MKFISSFYRVLLVFMLAFIISCSPIKTLEVWKDPSHDKPLDVIMIVAYTQNETIRHQYENVLSNELKKYGVISITSHDVLPAFHEDHEQEDVMQKVNDLGVKNVMVSRVIHEEDIINHQYHGKLVGGEVVYHNNGWYGYSYGYISDHEYETDYFTVSTKVYDAKSDKPFWSYLSQVKVEGSPQKAVNQYVPEVIKELQNNDLL